MPEVQRPLPPYLQIAKHYRDLIKSGELSDGDPIPGARELAREWQVAHATAAKVLTTLRSEGLTTTKGGRAGTIVSTGGLRRTSADRLESVRRWGRIYLPSEHARIVSAELVAAPDRVADALDVASGSLVIKRHRITLNGDTPVSVSTSWFHGDLAAVAPALLVTERLKQGTPGYIEQQTGRRAIAARDQLTAGLADAEVAAELRIAEGEPVLVGRSWFQDAAGLVVEYGEYQSINTRWVTYETVLDI